MLAAPIPDLRDNLPHPLTSFIGRAQDLSALDPLIRSTRLLTLTGVGGCGKSRLAREVAARALDVFPGGVRWVELAPLSDGALVPQAIAAVWGVVEQPGRSLLETLADALAKTLAPQRGLLVLDNCEHLLDSSAECAQFLLNGCPELTILTTSREPLAIAGEVVVPVAPLPVPDKQRRYDLLELARADAIGLFVERARAATPAFALTANNADDVARICRTLDGIPLALELAAARLRLLSVGQIAERLDNAFGLLASGSRSAPPRQQTLRATLDWSYGLLSSSEASLFRRLSVFADSFSLEAAEAVCAAADGVGDTLDDLGRLIDKSLVLTQERAGILRYRLLEVIRQYAREKLTSAAEDATISARHWDYFGRLARHTEAGLMSSEQRRWLTMAEDEHENLRAAITWSLNHGDPEQAGLVIGSLWRFWLMHGYLAEGCRWLSLALTCVPAATYARALVLQGLTVLTFHHQGYAAATALVEQTLALCRALNDPRALAEALLMGGILAHSHGDYADAVAYFEESLPLCSTSGWDYGISVCLNSMGFAVLHLGDIARALALCTASVEQAQATNDEQSVAAAQANLGIALLLGQRYDLATGRLEESVRLRREIGDTGGIAHTLCYLGRAAVEHGDTVRAEACFQESFALRDEMGDDVGLAAALEGLAVTAAARGEGATAAARFGAAETLRERAGMPIPTIDQPFHDRWLAQARDLLDEQTLATAWAAGRLLSPRDARDAESAVTPAASAGANESAAPAEQRPAPDMAARLSVLLRIFALGDARVYRQNKLVDASQWTYSRSRELLYFLLCCGSATKEQIGLALWPDSDSDQLRTQLHPVLHHLRHALGGPEWVVFERGRYRFNRTLGHAFDVETFERLLERATHSQTDDPEQAILHLEQALKLYRGDFLAGAHESEWLERKREELRRRRTDALLALGQLRFETAAYARAAQAYQQLIAADPYQERAHRELMRCLARLGERGQALRTFERLAGLLRRELGAEPAPETATLAARIRSGESV
jgi:predicted ATPase/DNA-binding SARP family transcriptional activator